MTEELSQTERTAMEEPFASDLTVGERAMWIHGRDYGRERERALEKALKAARRRIRQTHEAAFDSRRKEIATDAICEIDDALAASQPEVLSERSDTEPGEPERLTADEWKTVEEFVRERIMGSAEDTGVPITTVERLLMSKLAAFALSQPDHGPGEPSELERRLRFSLEKYGEHQGDCPAKGHLGLVVAKCTCGYHAALQANPVDVQVGESNG